MNMTDNNKNGPQSVTAYPDTWKKAHLCKTHIDSHPAEVSSHAVDSVVANGRLGVAVARLGSGMGLAVGA